jgi:hypothetical protein
MKKEKMVVLKLGGDKLGTDADAKIYLTHCRTKNL